MHLGLVMSQSVVNLRDIAVVNLAIALFND